jgi:hypothetical protein
LLLSPPPLPGRMLRYILVVVVVVVVVRTPTPN